MIRVHVRPYTILRDYMPGPLGRQGTEIQLEEGSTVQDMLRRLGIPDDKVMLVFVNDMHVPLDHPLREGDRIELLPPISGGGKGLLTDCWRPETWRRRPD